MADGARDRFEVLLAETLRSLEESGLKFALKAEQKKAIRHLFERKDVLDVLPTGYRKSLIFQLLVLLAKRAGYSAPLLVITPLVSIINDQIMEVEAMNLTACNLAQKLDSLQDIEGGKFEVIQIVNVVFRQHIAMYHSKKFVVLFRGRQIAESFYPSHWTLPLLFGRFLYREN